MGSLTSRRKTAQWRIATNESKSGQGHAEDHLAKKAEAKPKQIKANDGQETLEARSRGKALEGLSV